MNILIVGNGFDLAHGLPTKYIDFLKFIQVVLRIETFRGTIYEFTKQDESTNTYVYNQLHVDVQKYVYNVLSNDENKGKEVFMCKRTPVIDEIICNAKNNIWIELFGKSDTLINDRWIDFETEISRFVQHFEKIWNAIKLGDKLDERLDVEKVIKMFDKRALNIENITEQQFKEYKNRMLQDLNNLIRCLELYLEDCVRNIDIPILSPDIYDIKIDKVLSFNYSDTFERLYYCQNRFAEYDYIHGKSKIDSIPPNNMVLGIDEYLSDDERNKNVFSIEFKKYFQRIHKSTGCIYKNWIDQIERDKKEHHLYIFGHSLDITDKDILKKLITCPNIKTKIFYYDSDLGMQIANLVKVLDQNILISMAYANNKKIEFVKQRDMINVSNTDWQITNDIYSLWNIYKLNIRQAQDLLDRINASIKNKTLTYFDNQRKVISLFDALLNNIGDNKDYFDKLFDIACAISEKSSLHNISVFNPDDWKDVDYRGEHDCHAKTRQLIRKINEINIDSINAIKDFSMFDLSCLLSLYVQIKHYTVNFEIFEQLFNHLFLLFDDNEIDCRYIWKCIYVLIDKVSYSKLEAFIKEKKKETTDIIKSNRLNHIYEVINEREYDRRQAEAMAEYDDKMCED